MVRVEQADLQRDTGETFFFIGGDGTDSGDDATQEVNFGNPSFSAYQVAIQMASMVTLNMHHHQDIMHYVLKD